jgi:hypothetical protein
MLLGCVAEALPLQHEFDGRENYSKALRVFLDKHYKLTYVEITSDKFEEVSPSFHIMIGPTIRTVSANDAWHAVIGFGGKMFWDVHASRAGLTSVEGWGLLVPTPSDWRVGLNVACTCAECTTNESAVA